MQLQEDESKIKTFFHHPFPFFIKAVKIAIVSFPFFFVASFFQGLLGPIEMFLIYVGIAAIFALFIGHEGLLYFMDRIIVTNKRVIHVDWKTLFEREETEAVLIDIQDIETSEMGILSRFKIFDFGTFHVETASSKASIIFYDATDPEGIKHFVYHLLQKPSKIMSEALETSSYDRAYTEESEEAGVGRSRQR